MSPTDLRARVLADIAKTSSPTRGQYTRRILTVAVVGALATASIFLAMGGFDRGTRPVEMVVFTAGMALVSALLLTRLSTGQPGSMLGRPRAVLMTATVLGAAVLALSVLALALFWPAAARAGTPALSDWACGFMTLVQAGLPLFALLVPRRGSDPLQPALSGAALGMTAGAWTAMMAYLRCAHTDAAHCLLAHVVPTLVLTAIGAALGGWLLRVRSSPPSAS